ncbi:hypothetical protein ACFW6E_46310 [Streptomyces olivaceoviridis]|uniref:hypothetical protein n=1 Tax=Streptomyces olivaceoviridis TaxID=1921 RepID=UPI00369EECBA
MLLSHTFGRWDLLVIPPETAPATAAPLMATATDPSRSLTATGLIREAERFRAAARQRTRSGRRSGTSKAERTRRPPPCLTHS